MPAPHCERQIIHQKQISKERTPSSIAGGRFEEGTSVCLRRKLEITPIGQIEVQYPRQQNGLARGCRRRIEMTNPSHMRTPGECRHPHVEAG
eukprot:1460879-Amphidinium_carterae.2